MEVNVRGRDIGSFVKEAQDVVSRDVHLPPGYVMTWGGLWKTSRAGGSAS